MQRWVLVALAVRAGIGHADPRQDCADAELAASTSAKLQFEYGRPRLAAGDKQSLQVVADALRGRSDVKIAVIAHGLTGSDTAGLARKRADIVRWFLIEAGIESDRVEVHEGDAATSGRMVALRFGNADVTSCKTKPQASAPPHATPATKGTATLAQPQREGPRDAGVAIARSTRQVAQPAIARVSYREPTVVRESYQAPPMQPPVPAPESVVQAIHQRYMPGLSRCYRKGLADDPGLSGRVRVTFAVDASGQVVFPLAEGVESKVDTCIELMMRGWRFAPAHGDDADDLYTLTLALQP